MKVLLPCVLLLVLWSTSAFGWGGKLDSPSLTHRSDVDADGKAEIHKLLKFMKDELTFIEGSFINEFSNQRFGGTSAQVSRFIERLKAVGVWRVHVQFRDFGEQESAFSLDQDSSKDYLRVIINSGRKDFSLKDFAAYLPPPRLPQSAPPNAEQPDGAANASQPISSKTNAASPAAGPRH